MNNNTVVKLHKIASRLDENGQYEDANKIDDIIKLIVSQNNSGMTSTAGVFDDIKNLGRTVWDSIRGRNRAESPVEVAWSLQGDIFKTKELIELSHQERLAYINEVNASYQRVQFLQQEQPPNYNFLVEDEKRRYYQNMINIEEINKRIELLVGKFNYLNQVRRDMEASSEYNRMYGDPNAIGMPPEQRIPFQQHPIPQAPEVYFDPIPENPTINFG